MSSEESKTATFTGTVLVVGSSGTIGSAAVTALSTSFGSSGATIKAGTRNPDSDKAKAFNKLPGVTAVKADASTAATVAEESKGADVVVVVTPGTEDRGDLATVAVKAAAGAGVTNIIVISVPTSDAATHLFARQFKPLEAATRAASDAAVTLRLPFFTDNNWGHAGSIKGMGKFFAPVKPDAEYVSVAAADVGAAIAAITANFSAHAGKTYKLTSDKTSMNKIAAAFSETLGKEVAFVQVPPEAAIESLTGSGWPKWQAEGVVELWTLINEGREETVGATGDLEAIVGRKGTTTPAWVASVADGFRA